MNTHIGRLALAAFAFASLLCAQDVERVSDLICTKHDGWKSNHQQINGNARVRPGAFSV